MPYALCLMPEYIKEAEAWGLCPRATSALNEALCLMLVPYALCLMPDALCLMPVKEEEAWALRDNRDLGVEVLCLMSYVLCLMPYACEGGGGVGAEGQPRPRR
jgi:hypothetical protein